MILRAEQAGGFTAPAFQITRVPEFTLYGDGTVVYQLPVDPNADAPIGPPRLARATLTSEQMDALLAFAINAGGLGSAKAQYINPLVADAPGQTESSPSPRTMSPRRSAPRPSALPTAPNNPGATNPDAAAITALKALYDTLVPFGDQVARGNATDAVYEPTAYRATIQEGQPQGETIDWPWTDLTLDDFVANPDSSFRVATLTPDQARALSPTPEGGLFSVAVMGPDRVPYASPLRPAAARGGQLTGVATVRLARSATASGVLLRESLGVRVADEACLALREPEPDLTGGAIAVLGELELDDVTVGGRPHPRRAPSHATGR